MQTISRMYDDYADAAAVVSELESSGISHDNISLVANADAHGRSSMTSSAGTTASGDHPLDPADRHDSDASAGTKRGALAGTAVGGVAGLLAGIGALAIPGVGPVVAAGWLIATLTGAGVGAASGGLVGGLTGAGVSREEAETYHEGVKRGGSLVTVRAEDSDVTRVQSIVDRRNTLGWQDRRASYGADWTGPTMSDETRSGIGTTGAASPGGVAEDVANRPPGGRTGPLNR